MPRKPPGSTRNDLNDWAMTVQKGYDCCTQAQSNGADVVAKAVLSIVGQMISEALNGENRFLYLSFAPALLVPRGGTILNPKITGFPKVPLPSAIPVGAVLLAVGIELGNVYGRTVLLNAFSDMTTAVTQAVEQAQREITKPRTKTKRGIFDCDRCVREKSLPQHGSRLAVQ